MCAPVPDGRPVARTGVAPVLHDKMAQHQDCYNTTGQLFTVTSVESLTELHPHPHLHVIGHLSTDPHQQ